MKFKRHMNRHYQSGVIQGNLDKNERFMLRRCAVYLERLFDANPLGDRETVSMLVSVLGMEITTIVEALLEKVCASKKDNLLSEIAEKLDESDKAHDRLNDMLKKEGRNAGRLLEFLIENAEDPEEASDPICGILKKGGKKVWHAYVEASRKALLRRVTALSYSGYSDAEKKLRDLEKIFNLTEQEIVFAEFTYIVSLWQQGDEYFVDHLRCHEIFRRRYLKTILQMTDRELTNVLSGTLKRIEFYDMDRHSFGLTEDYLTFFQNSSAHFPIGKYFTRFSRKSIPLESHEIDSSIMENILKLLKVKQKSANHILLYGPPGTGKTSFALGLAKKLGVPSYEILRDESNTTSKRRAAILACLNMTKDGEGSLIVVDEADNLLNTRNSWFFRGETQDKGWLNQLLEEPGIRMIWITNSIDAIEGSVLRRFAFSVHFRAFNRRQRINLWESIIRRHRVKRCFTTEEIKRLAVRYPVSAAIIDLAVRKALETTTPDQPDFKEAVKMHLDAHVTLIHRGVKPRNKEAIEAEYSLAGLNVEGDLPFIMEHLKEFDCCLRRTDRPHAVRNFNLLFYGPPGSGKSELARYIAGHLDRELIVKRASDVVSPYIGETEQNISRIFDEAEAAEAVLVIDEADSFLFNRNRAVRSWEISQTNEFLTQMERFRGILICTTNRLEDLDQASIRRFNYKIGFRMLSPEGNVIFYRKLLSPLISVPLKQDQEIILKSIHDLTPGDFRVVRDRLVILPPEKVSHGMMLQALKEESRIKKMQEGNKPLGFLRTGS